jgi:uncharacterized FAD-dependent dehydrogenase
MVVSVNEKDAVQFHKHGPLMLLKFQQMVEQKCSEASGGKQSAPAQRLVDFIQKKLSATLPETSYQPGFVSAQLDEFLPDFISDSLRNAFDFFGKKMRGYITNEAVMAAVESRTSSPVRIPRNPEKLSHPQVTNLFPCGEGAGYAGGIVSAAIDGIRCAEAVAMQHQKVN